MGDFQFIFFMEWAHRLLGRVTGLAFLGELAGMSSMRQICADP